MSLTESLTPKDTEEVKPGLFIQKTGKGYKQIHPAAWNNKIIWKNLLLGPNFIKNFVWFLILMFLVFSYVHDTTELRGFQETINQYKAEWCAGVPYEELGEVDNNGETEVTKTILYNLS